MKRIICAVTLGLTLLASQANASFLKPSGVSQEKYNADKATQAKRDSGQDTAIAGKVDQSDYDSDKAAQALKDEFQDGAIYRTGEYLQQENAERVEADANLQAQVDTKVDKATQALTDKRQDTALKTETTQRKEGDAALQAQIDTTNTAVGVAQATGDYAHARIDVANQNIAANREALVNTNKRVSENSAAIAAQSERLGNLESTVSSGFSDLKQRIDKVQKRADAGVASVAAMANIPQVTGDARFSVGAGIGSRGGEQAIAVGLSSRLSSNVIGKVSVASDTQEKWTVGAGVAVQW